MIFTAVIAGLLLIPLYLRKVGVDWLFRRREIGIFILLFSRVFWWMLLFVLIEHWFGLDHLLLLSAILCVITAQVYNERFIYFRR
jgi:hypothetical protein